MKRAVPAAILLMLAACATSAPDRAARTASSLDVMHQNSAKARGQIDTVLASLDTLLNAPADRLRADRRVKQTAVAQSAQSEGARVKSAIYESEQAIDRLRLQIAPTN